MSYEREQVVLSNNPISGLLIIGSFAVFLPGAMLMATSTSLLGLFVSLLIGEPRSRIENGVTIFNPLLSGVVTYSLMPDIYDSFNARLFVCLSMSVVFSVYLTRALDGRRLPCLSAPFNIVQLIFLFTLSVSKASDSNASLLSQSNSTGNAEENSTTILSLFDDADGIGYNDTIANATCCEDLDWGMVFRGIVTSASQAFALNSVPVASIIYLAILTYSPVTAGFSFAGAFLGTITGLVLGVPVEEIYNGVWGYNALLSSAALGGFFIVVGIHTVFAAAVAAVFSTFLQNVLAPILATIDLPVLTVPFVLTTWLFLGLRNSEGSGFVRPETISFPEKQRHDYYEALERIESTAYPDQCDELNDVGVSTGEEKSLK